MEIKKKGGFDICTGRLKQVWVFNKIPWVLKNRFFFFGLHGAGNICPMVLGGFGNSSYASIWVYCFEAHIY